MLKKQNITGNNPLNEREFPAFSVLMAVYREEEPQYLNEALLSIENQTIVPTEIVVVEDGPLPDSLHQILEQHQVNFKGQFRIISNAVNMGLGVSLQRGMKYVENDWVARMDSDDIAVKKRFELQLKEIIKDPELGVVGGQVDEFLSRPTNIVGERKVPLSNSEIIRFIKYRSPFNHPTVMLNREKVLKSGGYQSKGKLEDYFLWVNMLANGYKGLNVPEVLVHMRTDTGMYDRRGDKENLKYIFTLKKMMHKKKMINLFELICGDLIMTVNIIAPKWLRKMIYQKFMHSRSEVDGRNENNEIKE